MAIEGLSERSAFTKAPLPVIGIVVALPEEAVSLTSQKLVQGECFELSRKVLIVYSGAGALNAANAAKLLIGKGVMGLVSWGCAAALAENLRPGDLVVPDRIISEQQDYFSDKQWRLHLENLLFAELPLKSGALADSSRIVAASADKLSINRQTGAIALDMESAAVFRIATQAGLPCLAIRAVADPAAMDLPQAVVQALNAQGRVELVKLLRFLLAHPWEAPALVKLGLHFNAALKTLKIAAKRLNDIVTFKD